jgi:hypothetical protein
MKFPGIKIHDTRMIRLMETLLHGGTTGGGWRAKDIHHAVLTAFGITADRYGLNQLRYDLRKMKAHGLLEGDGKRYAYRLSDKRNEGRPHVRALPQTALRPTRQPPLSPPARSCSAPEKQTRNRFSQSRRFHPQHHPPTGDCLKCRRLFV